MLNNIDGPEPYDVDTCMTCMYARNHNSEACECTCVLHRPETRRYNQVCREYTDGSEDYGGSAVESFVLVIEKINRGE